MRPGSFMASYESDEPQTHCSQPHQVKVADGDLTTSCLDSPGWWTTTKRMIERGSARFWARRGMAEPGGRTFGEQSSVEAARARGVGEGAARAGEASTSPAPEVQP